MEVVDEVLSRDFAVHILCSSKSLLVVLLQPLLIDVSHLYPQKCHQFIMITVYRVFRVTFCLWSSVASELWVISLSISAGSGSSARRSMPLSKGHPVLLWQLARVCIFICGIISLMSVSDLPKHGLEW